MFKFNKNPENIIVEEIKRFVAESPGNSMKLANGAPYFENPLVGFADTCDPLFEEFKTIIGEFHMTPIEFLTKSFPEHATGWQRASVISWILPISSITRKSNRKETMKPSPEWEETRLGGEAFNNQLREHVVSFIQAQGFLAAAPMLSGLFSVCQSEKDGFSSNWSERHTAYAAGLGTFCLTRALLTPAGVAMRCGSVVTNLNLKADPRPFNNFQQNCLFYNSGKCTKCAERCPGGAISEQGHNKDLCIMYIYGLMQESEEENPGCGLCQTGVPCEAGIPKDK